MGPSGKTDNCCSQYRQKQALKPNYWLRYRGPSRKALCSTILTFIIVKYLEDVEKFWMPGWCLASADCGLLATLEEGKFCGEILPTASLSTDGDLAPELFWTCWIWVSVSSVVRAKSGFKENFTLLSWAPWAVFPLQQKCSDSTSACLRRRYCHVNNLQLCTCRCWRLHL